LSHIVQATQESVVRRLRWDPEIASNDIGVSVADGVVTLTGYVRSSQEKLAAESLVRILPGVRAIANDILVAEPVSKTDPEIAREALAALAVNAGVPKEGITVTVRDGEVGLDGFVEWQFQRDSVETAIAGLEGVRSVSNRIEIRPMVSPSEIREKLSGADRVAVEVDDRTVRLTGEVNSWEERTALERAVWSTAGVARVENHIVVS
jgi:osmotically-inducible protein OsmY